MVQNFSRKPSKVVAYWGPNIYCRFQQEQTPDKIKESLEQQLILNGRPAWLWQPVRLTDVGIVACTCTKDTTQNSDGKCATCHSTGYAPGFFKFLHETLHFSSAEFASFTLTSLEMDRRNKPNRLRLTSGSTTGSLVTQDKAYTNPKSAPWELELAAYRKVASDTLTLEFSTNAGVSWTAITLTAEGIGRFRGNLVPAPTGSGTIRFRVTLTRLAGDSVESPSFEIVRARHVRLEDVNPELHKRPDYEDGQILVLKTWNQEQVIRAQMQGRLIEHVGDRMQTTPFDFFDLSITRETPSAVLDDREAGAHPFIEYTSGTRGLSRYVVTQVNIDDTINNVVSHQAFTERLAQEELYKYSW